VSWQNRKIELATGSHQITKEGYVRSIFLLSGDVEIISDDEMQLHVKAVKSLLSHDSRGFLVDITDLNGALSFEALRLWSSNQAINKHCLAEAYLIESLADAVFIWQHIRLNKLKYPARVFHKYEEATEWLKHYTNN